MIISVSIEPINKKMSEQSLPTVYTWRGKRRMLMEDDRFVDVELNPSKDKPWPLERILQTSKRGSAVITYKYESDPSKQNPLDKIKQGVVDFFWKNHPMVKVNGQIVKDLNGTIITVAPMFNMVNFTDKSIDDVRTWRDKLEVCQKVNEMSYDQKKDLMHYYGVNPKGKTENELILTLANFESGLALNINEIDNFKKIFINKGESDKDIIINIRKALSYNIIQEKSAEGRNSYYLGETFLGTAFNDIISFCKREENIYQEYIVRQVESKEEKPKVVEPVAENPKPFASPAAAPTEKHAASHTGLDPELDALKKEAWELKKAGFMWKGLSIDISTKEHLLKHLEVGRKKAEDARKASLV